MSTDSPKRSASVILGTPAAELSTLLDGILAQSEAAPMPDKNADASPYALEDLLAGLPTDPGAPAQPAEEPAAQPPLITDPDPTLDAVAALANLPGANEQFVELTQDMSLLAEVEPSTEYPSPVAPLPIGNIAERIDAILSEFQVKPRTDSQALPDNREALALLLTTPLPNSDFAALDALHACWPRSTTDSDSRALLAVAFNLSRNFGLPGKLPMASSKAWRMLSARVFQDDMARRLRDIGLFINGWQKSQRTFLILEFGEVETIETLFEALDPALYAPLMAEVMNFKVLSNRRLGLLRRIPMRTKRRIVPLLPARKMEALTILDQTMSLLKLVTEISGFGPVVEAATKAGEEVEKMMKMVAAIGAPPPPHPPGGIPLGRMG